MKSVVVILLCCFGFPVCARLGETKADLVGRFGKVRYEGERGGYWRMNWKTSAFDVWVYLKKNGGKWTSVRETYRTLSGKPMPKDRVQKVLKATADGRRWALLETVKHGRRGTMESSVDTIYQRTDEQFCIHHTFVWNKDGSRKSYSYLTFYNAAELKRWRELDAAKSAK